MPQAHPPNRNRTVTTVSAAVLLLIIVQLLALYALLKMGRYYNTTVCYYWNMSVK